MEAVSELPIEHHPVAKLVKSARFQKAVNRMQKRWACSLQEGIEFCIRAGIHRWRTVDVEARVQKHTEDYMRQFPREFEFHGRKKR